MHPSEIIATRRAGLVILTDDLRVEFASDRFLTMFEATREETFGRPLAALGRGAWNAPLLLEALGRIAAEGGTTEDREVERDFARIGRKVMRLNVRRTLSCGDGAVDPAVHRPRDRGVGPGAQTPVVAASRAGNRRHVEPAAPCARRPARRDRGQPRVLPHPQGPGGGDDRAEPRGPRRGPVGGREADPGSCRDRSGRDDAGRPRGDP